MNMSLLHCMCMCMAILLTAMSRVCPQTLPRLLSSLWARLATRMDAHMFASCPSPAWHRNLHFAWRRLGRSVVIVLSRCRHQSSLRRFLPQTPRQLFTRPWSAIIRSPLPKAPFSLAPLISFMHSHFACLKHVQKGHRPDTPQDGCLAASLGAAEAHSGHLLRHLQRTGICPFAYPPKPKDSPSIL